MSKCGGEALTKKLKNTKKKKKKKKKKRIQRNPIRFDQRWPVSELNQDESKEMLKVSHNSPPFSKPREVWQKVYGLATHHNGVPTAFLEGGQCRHKKGRF